MSFADSITPKVCAFIDVSRRPVGAHKNRSGLRVFATARNLKSMVSLQALGIETFSLDVTNADSISGLKKQIEELTGGTLNILVNNAYVLRHLFSKLSMFTIHSQWHWYVDVKSYLTKQGSLLPYRLSLCRHRYYNGPC